MDDARVFVAVGFAARRVDRALGTADGGSKPAHGRCGSIDRRRVVRRSHRRTCRRVPDRPVLILVAGLAVLVMPSSLRNLADALG